MTVEDEVAALRTDVAGLEEALRLLRDANRLQGRPLSAARPGHGDVASWNATTKKWEPVPGTTVIDRDLDTAESVSSTSEDTLYSHSIPADTLGATGGIKVIIAGDLLVNTDGGLIINVKLGATTAFSSPNLTGITQTATRYKWTFVITVMNSTTSAQKWTGEFNAVVTSGEFDAQLGNSASAFHMQGFTTSTEATTGALTFLMSATWDTSSASLSIKKEMAIMELLAAA